MASNNSLTSGGSLVGQINERVIIVQIFVSIFLCINFFQIIIFLMKESFRTTMRYIFFAVILSSDCMYLIMSNLLLILAFSRVLIQTWLCLLIFFLSSVYTFVTALTLTAMTLERYVAICMPLRHAELCSPRSSLHLTIIIHSISAMPCTITLSIFFSVAPLTTYSKNIVCTAEMFVLYSWQGHIRSAVSQFYFFVMLITIIVSYAKVLKVARRASGESKKSSWKALRTVILHGVQLLLSLVQLWCAFIEAAVLQIDPNIYKEVRYFNYITFNLAPRCLSPLIYGLRDEMFFNAMKYYSLCGMVKKQ